MYLLSKSLEKTRYLSYIYHKALVTYVKIKEKSFNIAVVMMPRNVVDQSDLQASQNLGCEKTAVYELLRTEMVGGSAHGFTRYHEKDTTPIRSHVHQEENKLLKNIIDYDPNSLCFYCSGDAMPFGQDTVVVNEKPFDQKGNEKFSKDVLKRKVFRFVQVDIEVPDKLYDTFSEMV